MTRGRYRARCWTAWNWIEISSHTENEKFHIAKEHLLEKQIKKNGLEKYDVTGDKRRVKENNFQLYEGGRRTQPGAENW